MNFKPKLADAIESNNLAMVRKLLEPIDLESNDYDGSVLHLAASWGSPEIVKLLVDYGADVDRPGGTFRAPAITYAAEKGRTDIVRILIESGSSVDLSTATRNPLLQAANSGHYEVVKYLLSIGVDPHVTYRIPSGALVNALADAERHGHKNIVELLQSHGCCQPVEGEDVPVWEPPEFRTKSIPSNPRKDEQIMDYMEQRFGPTDKEGMLEVVPVMEGVSVSVNVIQPNEIHPYFVFFTTGMSDLPLNVPSGYEDWQYAELVIHLPSEWVHPKNANSDLQWTWPIKWLREIAYLPHLNESWLGLPATIISSDDPPIPLGPGTNQTCSLLVPDYSNLDPPLRRRDGTEVHFYTVVPLFTDERNYELENGMEAFLRRFSEHNIPMTVDLDRNSFAEGFQ